MKPYEHGQPEGQFDPKHLKGLPNDALAEALLDDASYAATKLDGPERERTEAQLMGICWVLDEEEQADHEEWSQSLHDIMGQLGSALLAGATGEELDPDEAGQVLHRRQAGHSLEIIERRKDKIEKGLKTQNDRFSDWTEGSTAHALQEICGLQEATGINLYGDYIRETALSSLTNAGYLGVTLLRNSQAGDEASYQPGIDALHDAIGKESMDWGTALVGAKLLTELLHKPETREQAVLRDLAIDVLARMRGWMGIPGIPSYTYNYAFAAANLAVTLRNQQQSSASP